MYKGSRGVHALSRGYTLLFIRTPRIKFFMNDLISLPAAAVELGQPYPRLYAKAGELGAERIDGHLYFRRASLPEIAERLRERTNRSAA